MKRIYITFVVLLLLLIYKNWFLQTDIIGGDWPHFFQERLRETTLIPPSWNTFLGNGFGGLSPLYSLQFFHNFTISLANISNIPWEIVYKIVWFGFFIFLSFFSAIYLFHICNKKLGIMAGVTAGLIYTTNTYILMVVGGGQIGVGLGYAMCPLVVGTFIKLIDSIRNNDFQLSNSLLAGLFFAIQVMFDPRIAYLSLIIVGLYTLISLKKDIRFLFSLVIFVYILPLTITLLLHAPWILPIMVFRTNHAADLGRDYTGIGAFSFFSFADFSHSFSLLQPNWPENVFGKTGFLPPQFLFLPVIAYSALLFVKKDMNRKILFLCLTGLVGVFLAKGAHLPFGFLNSWMFEHIPGFVLFRDPTKFYTLIAISYAILIPYTLFHIATYIEKVKKKKGFVTYTPFFLFLFLWIYLLLPAVLGKIDKTLSQNQSIPQEYRKLESYLGKQSEFSRTLWIPRQQRFSLVSDTHPAVEAQPLFRVSSSSGVLAKLRESGAKQYIQDLGIKYIIVPFDPYGEVFFKDRKYDKKQYELDIQSLRSLSWLKEVPGFGRIAVFELAETKHHFWMTEGNITEKKIASDEYIIHITTKKPTSFVFVESYNPSWVARIDGKEIQSQKDKNGFNAFFIEKEGTFTGTIFFKQKGTLMWGWYITGITIIAMSGIFLHKR